MKNENHTNVVLSPSKATKSQQCTLVHHEAASPWTLKRMSHRAPLFNEGYSLLMIHP